MIIYQFHMLTSARPHDSFQVLRYSLSMAKIQTLLWTRMQRLLGASRDAERGRMGTPNSS